MKILHIVDCRLGKKLEHCERTDKHQRDQIKFEHANHVTGSLYLHPEVAKV